VDLGHVTRGEHIREIWEFVEKLKHETVCCPHCRRSNTETLNNRGQQKKWIRNQCKV
jgi:ribosomal protein L37AE/L43A